MKFKTQNYTYFFSSIFLFSSITGFGFQIILSRLIDVKKEDWMLKTKTVKGHMIKPGS